MYKHEFFILVHATTTELFKVVSFNMRYLFTFLSAAILSCSSGINEGESLVYLKSADGNFDLYQSDLLGQWERRLTDNLGWDWSPQWNDGTDGLIYYSNDTTEQFSIMSLDLKSDINKVLPNGELPNYHLSADGQFIYFTERDSTATNIKRCPIESAKDSKYLTNSASYNGRFSISTDNRWMAFISDRNGSNQLYLKNLESKEITQLTNGAMIAKYNTFSPDATKVAVTLAEPSDDPAWDIYIIDLETQEITQLTDTPYSEQEIAWSPSGKKIAFHGTSDADGDQIYTIDIADGKFTKITSGDFYHGEPAWLPFNFK